MLIAIVKIFKKNVLWKGRQIRDEISLEEMGQIMHMKAKTWTELIEKVRGS